MEIKVNVINEMKKLRSSTYSDKYTWVDEIIQNCQRAKATHVDIEVTPDSIVVSDNGIGCSDPQILFDKSSSGWDENTTKTESPFGEGFFSTMMAANTITVMSVGFTATFDVKRMFEENTTDTVEIQSNRKRSGFTITLSDLCDDVNYYIALQRFKDVAKYIKSPSFTLNGERVKYEGLNPDIDKPFIRKVNTPYFKGWIRPYSWHFNDWGQKYSIKCFAFNRLIKNSTKYADVCGVLNFKDGAINLRSPDRKEFIFDEKYNDMLLCLENEIKKMYLSVIKTGDDSTISHLEWNINRYMDIDDYKPYIKFKFINPEPLSETINPDEQTLDDEYCSNMDAPDDDTLNDMENEYSDGDIQASSITDIDTAKLNKHDDFAVERCISSTRRKTESNKKKTNISAQTGELLNNNLSYGFYIMESEENTYHDQITLALQKHIPILTIRNNLERKIVEDDVRFNHMASMDTMITLVAEYSNMIPCSPQEIRANKLLSRVANALGAQEDLFIIGDTSFKKVLTIDENVYTIENIESIATGYDDKIYINRKHLSAYKDLADTSSTLTDADVKFLLLNLETISSEISKVVHHEKENTVSHLTSTTQYMQEIINLIYGKKSYLNSI